MKRKHIAGPPSKLSKHSLPGKEFDKLWEERILQETSEDSAWMEFIKMQSPRAEDIINMEDYWHQPDDTSGDDGELLSWADYMYNEGWEFLDRSVRAVYYKGPVVLKVALDGNGLAQNFMEMIAYADGVDKLIDGEPVDEYIMRVPKYIATHPRSYWIATELVDGYHLADQIKSHSVQETPPEIRRFFESIDMGDPRPANFLIRGMELWCVDLGLYKYDIEVGHHSL